MTVWTKTKSWRVTSGWNCKALQHVQNAQWPSEKCNYFMTIQPKTKSCIFTCGCNCKALLLRMHRDSDRQLSMTIWPKTKSCRVTCDFKALTFFRMHSDQKRRQWQYGPRQRVVELPVTVRPLCCSECPMAKRDSCDSMAQDKEL